MQTIKELNKLIDAVTKKGRDYVIVIDGKERCGMSVLGMVAAQYLYSKGEVI